MEEECWIEGPGETRGKMLHLEWEGTLKEYSGITQGKDGILKVGRVASGVGGYSEEYNRNTQ